MSTRCPFATVVIRESFDVILAEIIAALDFDKHERFVADIGDAVLGSKWNHQHFT